MVSSTSSRVQDRTSVGANRRIARETEGQVALCAQGGPERISQRLHDLDAEWDIERTLQTNFAAVALAGAALGAFVDRRLSLLSAVAAGFMLQHALQGWCPPLPLFRGAGVRTASEINQERAALKALRGDFEATRH